MRCLPERILRVEIQVAKFLMASRKEVVSLNERQFILESLRENLRVDGRRTYDVRTINISFGNSNGYAEVQLGATRVICIVSGQLVKPFPGRPTEGFFHFNTEFSPMADPSFELGR